MITNLPEERSLQYIPAHREPVDGCGFDDDGERVPICGFELPQDEPERDHLADAAEIVGAFMDRFTSKTPLRAGQELLCLCYLSGRLGLQSDAQLARRLGISASRVSHLLRELNPDFASVSKCGRRQKKPVQRKVVT